MRHALQPATWGALTLCCHREPWPPTWPPAGQGPAPGHRLAHQNSHCHFIILEPGKLLFVTANLNMQ